MSEDRDPSDIFRERLKSARDLRKWNQAELAKHAEMPPSSIAHFESGSRKPSFATLRRLANALDVSTDFLLGRVDDPGMTEAGDPLYRHVSELSGSDRELAQDFLKMLSDRSAQSKDES